MEASPIQIRGGVGFGSPNNLLRRQLQLNPSRVAFRSPASQRNGLFMQHESGSKGNHGYVTNTSTEFKTDQPAHSSPAVETSSETLGTDRTRDDGVAEKQKGTAKIHDFCFGIPFGGFVFGGGLFGFLFTRNLAVLSTGFLFGGALLALSTCSLKVWRQGKSSLPFILGQSAIAAVLFVKNFQTYSMTKKLFPTGFYALFSAAMLCFYFYVMISGGNPPPKKSKLAATAAT